MSRVDIIDQGPTRTLSSKPSFPSSSTSLSASLPRQAGKFQSFSVPTCLHVARTGRPAGRLPVRRELLAQNSPEHHVSLTRNPSRVSRTMKPMVCHLLFHFLLIQKGPCLSIKLYVLHEPLIKLGIHECRGVRKYSGEIYTNSAFFSVSKVEVLPDKLLPK